MAATNAIQVVVVDDEGAIGGKNMIPAHGWLLNLNCFVLHWAYLHSSYWARRDGKADALVEPKTVYDALNVDLCSRLIRPLGENPRDWLRRRRCGQGHN